MQTKPTGGYTMTGINALICNPFESFLQSLLEQDMNQINRLFIETERHKQLYRKGR
jgi:hypothetical protein